MSVQKFYIHMLVIAAIFMAGISPACAFISGKGFIEICAPDGTLQTVEVDAAFDPFAEPVPLSDHLEAMEQCSYCFAMDHQKSGEAGAQVVAHGVSAGYLAVSAGTAIPLVSRLVLYQPRGPPSFS